MGKLSKANHINSGTDLAHNRLDLVHNRLDLAHNKPELCPLPYQNCPIRDWSLTVGSGGGGGGATKQEWGGHVKFYPYEKRGGRGRKCFSNA